MSRVICFIKLKGGNGATYTAAQMGYLLSNLYNKRVLLVDNDKQGDLSKYYEVYKKTGICPIAQILKRGNRACTVY